MYGYEFIEILFGVSIKFKNLFGHERGRSLVFKGK